MNQGDIGGSAETRLRYQAGLSSLIGGKAGSSRSMPEIISGSSGVSETGGRMLDGGRSLTRTNRSPDSTTSNTSPGMAGFGRTILRF